MIFDMWKIRSTLICKNWVTLININGFRWVLLSTFWHIIAPKILYFYFSGQKMKNMDFKSEVMYRKVLFNNLTCQIYCCWLFKRLGFAYLLSKSYFFLQSLKLPIVCWKFDTVTYTTSSHDLRHVQFNDVDLVDLSIWVSNFWDSKWYFPTCHRCHRKKSTHPNP